MSALDTDSLVNLAEELVVRARRRGVDVAEAQARAGWELSTKVRLGETEVVQEAGHRSVFLRVMLDKRVALTSSSDISDAGLERCVNDAIELLELSERDEWAGPVDSELLTKAPFPDLDLYDPALESITAADAIERAKVAERAALDFDPRITLSEGATFSRVTGASALVLSSGFTGWQRGSYASLNVAPVAMDSDGKRRRGHHWAARRHLAALTDGVSVGQEAARRTLRQLGPRKVPSTEAPVIFDKDAARSIIGTFAGCILGGAIWRKSSYLSERSGTQVASSLVNLTDNPLMPRGPGSRGFDGEGVASRVNSVVENGHLKTFLLDSYSGRKLGLPTTASGSRGGGSVSASTTNFIMQAGNDSPEALIANTPRGLFVTEMMGFGFNAVTGDFSRGASGFWIEDGKLAYPVSELTISGNLNQMLLSIDAIANDVDDQTSIVAPTFRISQMTIAGT